MDSILPAVLDPRVSGIVLPEEDSEEETYNAYARLMLSKNAMTITPEVGSVQKMNESGEVL